MFHEKLKQIRTKKGKTQKELADYLNISPQSVSKWEKGEALPSIEYLPKIAQFYDCDINLFFEIEKPKSIKENLQAELKKLERQLSDLEGEEPDEESEDYEEWEEKTENLQDEIDRIKARLNVKKPKQSECSTDQYEEFFKIAKEVIGEDKNHEKLTNFFIRNAEMKKSIFFIYELMIRLGGISISILQRKMEIGYNKAGRIIDGLEEIGLITPFDGVTNRKLIDENLKRLRPFLE